MRCMKILRLTAPKILLNNEGTYLSLDKKIFFTNQLQIFYVLSQKSLKMIFLHIFSQKNHYVYQRI